jgi:hypothetical protein
MVYALAAEKTPRRNRRHQNRSPWQEVTAGIEGREESYAQTTAGHCIQHAVTCSSKEKIAQQCRSTHRQSTAPECDKYERDRNQSGKYEGMGETTVSPEIAVVNSVREPDYVEIRNHRAREAGHPDPLWHIGPIKTTTDGKSATACVNAVAISFLYPAIPHKPDSTRMNDDYITGGASMPIIARATISECLTTAAVASKNRLRASSASVMMWCLW